MESQPQLSSVFTLWRQQLSFSNEQIILYSFWYRPQLKRNSGGVEQK